MKKIKYVCIFSERDKGFTIGNIYEGYPDGCSHIISDDGFKCLFSIRDFLPHVEFVPLEDILFMIKCTESCSSRFIVGKFYFVNKKGHIVHDDGNSPHLKDELKNFGKWYKSCGWYVYNFELIKDYTKEDKEEKEDMKDKTNLNKGIEGDLVQDVYKAVQNKDTGQITFNTIKMINVVFVKHDNSDKIYAFENKSDKRLKQGTKVKVDTYYGAKDAVVISSIKIQQKYLPSLMKAVSGELVSQLRQVIGVYKKVQEEKLIKIGGTEDATNN